MKKLDNNYFVNQIKVFIDEIINKPFYQNLTNYEKNLLILNYIVTVIKNFYDENNLVFNIPTGMEIYNIATQINLAMVINKNFYLTKENNNVVFKTRLNTNDILKVLDEVKSKFNYSFK